MTVWVEPARIEGAGIHILCLRLESELLQVPLDDLSKRGVKVVVLMQAVDRHAHRAGLVEQALGPGHVLGRVLLQIRAVAELGRERVRLGPQRARRTRPWSRSPDDRSRPSDCLPDLEVAQNAGAGVHVDEDIGSGLGLEHFDARTAVNFLAFESGMKMVFWIWLDSAAAVAPIGSLSC